MSRDALVVGINNYSFLSPLKAPALDAEAIAQRLEQYGEFRKVLRLPEKLDTTNANISTVSPSQSVSQLQLEQALEQLFCPDSSQAPETALFYFSGHGIPDRKGYDRGYLATSDTNPRVPRTGISLRWLQWLLSKGEVKQQIIWLDCCHSGSLLINVGAANPGHSDSRDRCFIASSRDFESSWEDPNSPYSVLTKALLDGLDPTRLPGRWIDTFALVDYVNQALKGELQTPVCTNFGEAIDLTKTWQVKAKKASFSSTDSSICPYKGLEFFDCNEEDPKYFFGREQLVGQLLDHVRTQSFLALVGASGNGKSSVLRAGLLHQLKLGRRILGSDTWQILITRPDVQPIKNLASAFVPKEGTQLDRAEAIGRAEGLLKEGAKGLQRLVQASKAPRTILVIDQFEEVFTRCDKDEERSHFFECLMGALTTAEDRLCVIIAMRADFVGKCLAQNYSGLAKSLPENTISVLPLAEDDLRAAICKPAEQVGLTIEQSLLTTILNDIKSAPGSLPLLQYTLKELWQRRQGSQITLSDYQSLGGISGTLDKRATEIYDSFGEAKQRTVQHIFQQLTQLGEGTEDTRRRVFLDNLIAEPLHTLAQVREIVNTLSSKDNRLLVTSEVVSKGNTTEHRAIVDVAHEALIRHWKLLQQWIEQNRDLLRQQRRIENSMVAWQDRAKDCGYLLQATSLAEAIRFRDKQSATFPLSDATKAFIQTSILQQRRNRLRTASWLVIPAALVVGLVEYNVRETRVSSNYASLSSNNVYERKRAVQELVKGCFTQQQSSAILNYFAERFFGNCRSLEQVDLRNADLSNVDLSHANLTEANLVEVDFENANLSNTNLSEANLTLASISNAKLRNANLRYADLRRANLHHTDLSGANLGSTELIDAILYDANFSGANFSNAKFSGADLSYTNLSNANLSDADLSGVYLIGAYLRATDLSGANLSRANLSNATFIDTDLNKTNFKDAVLVDSEVISKYANGSRLGDVALRQIGSSSSIFLSTDLRFVNNLSIQQLQGIVHPKVHPLICGSPLPESINIEDEFSRDCNRIAETLSIRHSNTFKSLETAKEFVIEQREKHRTIFRD